VAVRVVAVIIEDNPLFSPFFKGVILKTHGKAGDVFRRYFIPAEPSQKEK
jgi:hypothetical protein